MREGKGKNGSEYSHRVMGLGSGNYVAIGLRCSTEDTRFNYK